MNKQFFINQLNKLPFSRKLEVKEHYANICCPTHNNGQERTPSLRINLDNHHGFAPGSSKCFACSEKYSWDELAKILKLKKLDDANLDFNFEIPNKLRKNLLEEDESKKEMSKFIEFSPLWKKDENWRGISGKLLYKLDARLTVNKWQMPQLYLPVIINKEFMGGISCRLTKKKGFTSYINDEGPWVKKSLYPYDYVKNLLKRQKNRVVFIGEGPRDSLNPLQYGLPALCNMGGITVWSKEKADLILDLEPDLVVIATDPDEIGDRLCDLIKQALQKQVKLKRLNFPRKNKESKEDPGSMTKDRCLRLKKQLGII